MTSEWDFYRNFTVKIKKKIHPSDPPEPTKVINVIIKKSPSKSSHSSSALQTFQNKKEFTLEMQKFVGRIVNECVEILKKDPREYHPFYLTVETWIKIGKEKGYIPDEKVSQVWERCEDFASSKFQQISEISTEESTYEDVSPYLKVILDKKQSSSKEKAAISRKLRRIENSWKKIISEEPSSFTNFKELKTRLKFFDCSKNLSSPEECVRMNSLWSWLLSSELEKEVKTATPSSPPPVRKPVRKQVPKEEKVSEKVKPEKKKRLAEVTPEEAEAKRKKDRETKLKYRNRLKEKLSQAGIDKVKKLIFDWEQIMNLLDKRKLTLQEKAKLEEIEKEKESLLLGNKHLAMWDENRKKQRDRWQNYKDKKIADMGPQDYNKWRRKWEEKLSPEEKAKRNEEECKRKEKSNKKLEQGMTDDDKFRWKMGKYLTRQAWLSRQDKESLRHVGKSEEWKKRKLENTRKWRKRVKEERDERRRERKNVDREKRKEKLEREGRLEEIMEKRRIYAREKYKNETKEEREKRNGWNRAFHMRRTLKRKMEKEGDFTEEKFQERLKEMQLKMPKCSRAPKNPPKIVESKKISQPSLNTPPASPSLVSGSLGVVSLEDTSLVVAQEDELLEFEMWTPPPSPNELPVFDTVEEIWKAIEEDRKRNLVTSVTPSWNDTDRELHTPEPEEELEQAVLRAWLESAVAKAEEENTDNHFNNFDAELLSHLSQLL